MLRWLHERFRRHRWSVVSHLHDVEQGGETFDYHLQECRCRAIREFVIVKHESEFLGVRFGFAEVTVRDLDSLEDAKVWADR